LFAHKQGSTKKGCGTSTAFFFITNAKLNPKFAVTLQILPKGRTQILALQ